jgi:hypothetical protein
MMNERIRELIDQCTSYSDGSTWTSREEFDKEKFAELIVKECADIATNRYQRLMDGGKAIKQHFGVE